MRWGGEGQEGEKAPRRTYFHGEAPKQACDLQACHPKQPCHLAVHRWVDPQPPTRTTQPARLQRDAQAHTWCTPTPKHTPGARPESSAPPPPPVREGRRRLVGGPAHAPPALRPPGPCRRCGASLVGRGRGSSGNEGLPAAAPLALWLPHTAAPHRCKAGCTPREAGSRHCVTPHHQAQCRAPALRPFPPAPHALEEALQLDVCPVLQYPHDVIRVAPMLRHL